MASFKGLKKTLRCLLSFVFLLVVGVLVWQNGQPAKEERQHEILEYPDAIPAMPLAARHSAPLLPRGTTPIQHKIMLFLVESLLDLFQRVNVTVVLKCGSLIGSYVSHDVLPWDDDLDLTLSLHDLPKVKRLFRDNTSIYTRFGIHSWGDPPSRNTEFDLDTLKTFPLDAPDEEYYNWRYQAPSSGKKLQHKFKFYLRHGRRLRGRIWTWPYIDLTFYDENSTHIWMTDRKGWSCDRSVFYPLVHRPLGRLWVLAPFDSQSFLYRWYRHRFSCTSSSWNHTTEHPQAPRNVRCSSLTRYYPFVHRQVLDDGLLEVLYQNGRILHTIKVQGITNPILPVFGIKPSLLIKN